MKYSKFSLLLKLKVKYSNFLSELKLNILFLFLKVVGSINGLRGSTLRVCVTDNAANMLAAVPKHTKKVDMGLPCFDHLLNLVVKAANINDEDVQEAIKVKFEVFKFFVLIEFYIQIPVVFEVFDFNIIIFDYT